MASCLRIIGVCFRMLFYTSKLFLWSMIASLACVSLDLESSIYELRRFLSKPSLVFTSFLIGLDSKLVNSPFFCLSWVSWSNLSCSSLFILICSLDRVVFCKLSDKGALLLRNMWAPFKFDALFSPTFVILVSSREGWLTLDTEVTVLELLIFFGFESESYL